MRPASMAQDDEFVSPRIEDDDVDDDSDGGNEQDVE